jgi:hypothetical protein
MSTAKYNRGTMRADLFRILLVGYLTFLSAGCNPVAATNLPEAPVHPPTEATAIIETQTIPTVPTPKDHMETEPSLPIPSIPGLPALIEKAKEDLAQRLSVASSQINIVEAKEVFWPDASLGCPQPSTTYEQVEVRGYLILLQANGDQFEYHANIHNYVFYCENPTPPSLETPASGPP